MNKSKMNKICSESMVDVSVAEALEVDGSFGWCEAFFIAGGAGLGGGLTGGAGAFLGARIGMLAGEVLC